MPGLFDPFALRDLTLRNRIGVAPMCQYSSADGAANDRHLVHLGARAAGGAGLVITEATAIEPRGRISPFDLGLWDDSQIAPLRRITDFVRAQGAASAIQLAHAGRKASRTPAWGMDGLGRERGLTEAEGAWSVCAPSPIPMLGSRHPLPEPLDAAAIQHILDAFAAAAARAHRAGFDAVEVHAAHGHLANSFASPISNWRTDAFGGDLAGRAQFLIEIARAIRSTWPEGSPLLFRLSATDGIEGGWTIEDTVEANRIVAEGDADLILLGRAIPIGRFAPRLRSMPPPRPARRSNMPRRGARPGSATRPLACPQ